MTEQAKGFNSGSIGEIAYTAQVSRLNYAMGSNGIFDVLSFYLGNGFDAFAIRQSNVELSVCKSI